MSKVKRNTMFEPHYIIIIIISVQTLKAAETHLRRATCERSYYCAVVQDCKIAVHVRYFTGSPTPVFSPPPPGAAIPSGSGPACMHYSFDFAQ